MQPDNPIDSSPDDDGLSQSDIGAQNARESGSSDPLNPYEVTSNAPMIATVERPRWWTSILIVVVSLVVFIFASAVMSIVGVVVVHGRFDMALLTDTNSFVAVSESRIGLFLLVVLPQIALVVPSFVAGYCSPVETRKRLSLVRGHWPIWAWIGAALATPLVGLLSSVVVGLFMEESENLKALTDIFRAHGESGFLFPLMLMIGLTPAICEEVLFRGYVQTRLTRSLGPVGGILIASLLFAVFHLDFVHIIAVFPLGFYLGLVVWRSGSLFPAMIGHFINNSISVAAVVLAPTGNTNTLDAPSAIFSLSIIIFGIIGSLSAAFAWVRCGPPPTGKPIIAAAQQSDPPFA